MKMLATMATLTHTLFGWPIFDLTMTRAIVMKIKYCLSFSCFRFRFGCVGGWLIWLSFEIKEKINKLGSATTKRIN
jgi:hypothetical protein